MLLATIAALALMLRQVAAPFPAQAAAGDLDSSFGSGGWAVAELGGPASASAVAIQSDGAIVVAGTTHGRLLLVRYLANGTIDEGFGGDGKVTIRIGSGDSGAAAVAIQPDGKVVAAGYAIASPRSHPRMAAVRFLSDGTPDASFGQDGRVVLHSVRGRALGVQVLQDGGILLQGVEARRQDFWYSPVLVRLDEGGTLDTAFGTDGVSTADMGRARVTDLAADPEGGTYALASIPDGFKIARFGADGALEPGFGRDGIRRYRWEEYVSFDEIALDGDGRILVAGWTDSVDPRRGTLVWLTSTGTLDTSFSEDGLVEFDATSPVYWCAILPQPDGMIVLGGAAFVGAGSGENNSLLVRLTGDGTLDPGFGDGGVVVQPGPPGTWLGFTNGCSDAVTQADGKIVLVTSPLGFESNTSILAARFLAS
jgi:uncharacterized delta-60 repeat protein